MIEDNPWENFFTTRCNPIFGGGIWYCLKYNEHKLKIDRNDAIGRLKELGVRLIENKGYIRPSSIYDLNEEEGDEADFFLDELSLLNEAIDFSYMGFDQFNNISELVNGTVETYTQLIRTNDQHKAMRFTFKVIPDMVLGLRNMDQQYQKFSYKLLSEYDEKEISDLLDFAERQKHVVDGIHQNIFNVN